MNLLHVAAWLGIAFAVVMVLVAVVFGPMPRDRESWGYLFKGLGLLSVLVVLGLSVVL